MDFCNVCDARVFSLSVSVDLSICPSPQDSVDCHIHYCIKTLEEPGHASVVHCIAFNFSLFKTKSSASLGPISMKAMPSLNDRLIALVDSYTENPNSDRSLLPTFVMWNHVTNVTSQSTNPWPVSFMI